ncbi:hypothetical protein XENOCAPTIV_002323 [Xenoophorus captivus]|uniref:Uncharacterized protein n=1 Tax=Xenoophorus captivus TaxID=1517983 RepID=A0ABV0QZ75_9TELE
MTNILPLIVLKGLGCNAHNGGKKELQPFLFVVSPCLGYTTCSYFPCHPRSLFYSPQKNRVNIKDIPMQALAKDAFRVAVEEMLADSSLQNWFNSDTSEGALLVLCTTMYAFQRVSLLSRHSREYYPTKRGERH